MFVPDVQGPISNHTLALILKEKADLTMIGGPPLYLTGFRIDEKLIEKGIGNLGKIVENSPYVIIEHHILRDENWKTKISKVFEKAEKTGHKILTAAEFLGRKNMLLEASRKRLFAEIPPSREFEKWMQKNVKERKRVKPPV